MIREFYEKHWGGSERKKDDSGENSGQWALTAKLPLVPKNLENGHKLLQRATLGLSRNETGILYYLSQWLRQIKI